MSIGTRLLNAIFGPKDFFERSKKRLTRVLIVPVFALAIGPALLSGGLLLAGQNNGNSFNILISTLADSGESVLVLVLLICSTYALGLILNFQYGMFVKKGEFEVRRFARSVEAIEAYTDFANDIRAALEAGETNSAISISRHLLEFHDEAFKQDAVMIRLLVDYSIYEEVFSKPKLLAAPQVEKIN